VSEPINRVLVLGLGNDILTDDAVGLQVVRGLCGHVRDLPGVDVQETTEMGLALLDFVVGYDDLVLVDSVHTGKFPPGYLHELGDEELKTMPVMAPHFFGVGETLALGRKLGMKVPERARVLAVEVADPFTVSTEMTPALQAALPRLVERVLEMLRDLGRQPMA
jgi:hydrogenase maturation protease